VWASEPARALLCSKKCVLSSDSRRRTGSDLGGAKNVSCINTAHLAIVDREARTGVKRWTLTWQEKEYPKVGSLLMKLRHFFFLICQQKLHKSKPGIISSISLKLSIVLNYFNKSQQWVNNRNLSHSMFVIFWKSWCLRINLVLLLFDVLSFSIPWPF
jgi:hypothetical protein